MTGLTIKKPPRKALQHVRGAPRLASLARVPGRNKQQPDRFSDLNQGLIFYENLFFSVFISNTFIIYHIEFI